MNFLSLQKDCLPARLVVVTKQRSSLEILDVLQEGATDIAENRVQEASKKFAALSNKALFKKCKKHLIGHLQTNKIRDALRLFDMIQSVDSFKLAEALNNEAAMQGKKIEVLLQVNVSNDSAKFGIAPKDLPDFWNLIKPFKSIKVRGLMTITQQYKDSIDTKKDFIKMKEIFDKFINYSKIADPILSMGMSADYKLSIKCGSNMVRLGRAIFQ